MKPGLRAGLRVGLIVLGLSLAVTAGWAANRTGFDRAGFDRAGSSSAGSSSAAHTQMNMPTSAEDRSTASLEQRCRPGAFTEAASIINSVVDIARTLPANTPTGTRAELDTVLDTALKQARTEVHCVAGGLRFGYEKSYAEVIRHGLDLARMRHLPKSLIETAGITVKILEQNQPVTVSSPR